MLNAPSLALDAGRTFTQTTGKSLSRKKAPPNKRPGRFEERYHDDGTETGFKSEPGALALS